MKDWNVDWEAAEAQWVIQSAIAVDLPRVATDALVHGWDSPSLRLLPLERGRDPRDVRDLFLAAVAELGRELPCKSEAARRLLRYYARSLDDGRLDFVTGARAIARIGYDADIPED